MGEPCETASEESLLERLVERDLLSQGAAARAKSSASEIGASLVDTLIDLGLLAEDQLAAEIADYCGLTFNQNPGVPEQPVLSELFNPEFLRQQRCVPTHVTDEVLTVLTVHPFSSLAQHGLQFAANRNVILEIATRSDIARQLDSLYGASNQVGAVGEEGDYQAALQDLDRLQDLAAEAPVIRLVSGLISRAVEVGASDIHFEPSADRLRVRIRVDGELEELNAPPLSMAAAVISRIKILAHLDIAERRLPQDGRMRMAVRGRDIDFRVATTPTVNGESVVLRILDRSNFDLGFDALGYRGVARRSIDALLEKPHGIILATGPTGSGKTTTLYAALKQLNQPETKVLTVEDPVEITLDGVNQVQADPKIGRTFASTLRGFLRQDPDILMVGEIRDLETAEIAIQAALTGHLVLSTLHTNDAPSAIPRLVDMGIEPFLLAATLEGVIAQRLIRVLCDSCKVRMDPKKIERLKAVHREEMSDVSTLFAPAGCSKCRGTGYSGRTSIHEIFMMTEAMRGLIQDGASLTEIRKIARKEGMVSLFEHGIDRVCSGTTSIEEIFRVTQEVF